jgi:precorrin-3B C17-methyltransferase
MTKIYVVGIGPGSPDDMTPRAREALACCDYIVGYSVYVDMIRGQFPQKQFISMGMTGEIERCRLALEKAKEGNVTVVVSSGDSGIYGMAGLMLEIAGDSTDISVEIIPGITAASAAAAVLGAPLMHDFAVISLSDCLTPWEIILNRIKSAAASDFILCLYNPKSKSRTEYISIVRDELIKHRPLSTPVGIVWKAGRSGQRSVITDLEKMLEYDIDMFSTVIVGNTQTYVKNEKMITPRGYML